MNDPSKCAMCMTPFVKTPKGFNRKRLSTFTDPGTAYKFCQRVVYLENFVCHKCKSVIVRNTVRAKKKNFWTLKREKSTLKKEKRTPKIEKRQEENGGHENVDASQQNSMKESTSKAGKRLRENDEHEGEENSVSSPTPKAKRKAPFDAPPQHLQEFKKEDDNVGAQAVSSGSMNEGENERQESQKSSKILPIERAVTYLENYEYLSAVRALCKVSPKAKQAVIDAVTEMIRSEIKAKPKIQAFQQEVSHATVASFSWEDAMEEAQQSLPATVSCTWAMVGLKKKKKENKRKLAPRAGQIMSVALYTNSRSNKFAQSCFGLELWKKRANKKVFRTVNHMGLSLSEGTARNTVDAIAQQHEQELLNWKENAQAEDKRSRKVSYGFSCKELQLRTRPKTPTAEHSSTSSSQAMCLAVKNRIAGKSPRVQVPAADLDPYTFLPSPDVFERQRWRAIFLVKHLISKHLTILQHLQKKLPSRIDHAHTKEMDQKSQFVTIGFVDADPSSTQGMVSVMEHLQKKHVPVAQGKPTPCLLSGDAPTIERILHAQMDLSGKENQTGYSEALYACPQEFHKELLHMQDSNDKFFKATSVADRGTIAQLKKDFIPRPFKIDAIENRQQAWDLYKFATESHIILYAMKLCGMTSLDDVPEGFRSKKNPGEQLRWLNNLAERVVDFCWSPPDRGDVHVAAAVFDEKLKDVAEGGLRYCLCNTQEQSGEMVLCCSKTCKHSWFHLGCLGLDRVPESDEDWYCSTECAKSKSYIYCFCHKEQPATVLVQCHLAEHCKKFVWYHKNCVSSSKDDPMPDKWYCSDECALGAEQDDHVLNHTKALMYEGLCHLIRRQAVRDGNGPAMVDDWKADMVTFHERQHSKYLTIGHYFLACVGGFVDPALQVNFVWNRVANPKGNPGGNVGLDLVDEFVDCTGIVRTSGVNTTLDQFTRYAQMDGLFGRNLKTLFAGAGVVDMEESSRRPDLYDKDIQRFTQEYQADALFEYIPGREHSAFGEFESSSRLQNPKKLGQKLQGLSTKLDMWKNRSSSGKES